MTEQEYEAALKRIEALMEKANASCEESCEFDRLVDAVYEYEDEHYPIEPPSAEAMEQFRREQEGKTDER